MQSLLSKSWDNFYVNNPDGGPWDKVVKPDEHIIDFVQNYQFKKGVTALDSGCADGRNTKYLVEEGFQVTGIDISTTVINRVKDKVPSGKFLTADAKRLPFANSCFDVICDAGALHVNAPGDVSLILKEYQRVLSKKGVLFIRVFNKTVNDSDLPIFFVDSPNNSMPVYGYSKEKFASIASRYFHVEKIIYDPSYGMQGEGCNYFYCKHF